MNQERAALKILVAEDHAPSRVLLQRFLGQSGYVVIVAHDGEQAVEKFRTERPELVLMDVMMPKMDGYEAARNIKAMTADDFVPLIFLTAIQDEYALAKCVEAGGDAFLTKPYTHTILNSKIDAMLRIRDLHANVRKQNVEISQYQQQLLHEQRIAEKVFRAVVGNGAERGDGVRSLISPNAVFNGDLFLTATRATGELHFMVADFTGHGLSAAIGAVPASDIFYSMTASGFGVADIAETINRKIKTILPADMFCAACLAAVDTIECKLTVWNGGMPPVFVVDHGNNIRLRAPSQHLPLGVLGPAKFDRAVRIFALDPGDRIFACTDGLVDAPIAAGGRFSQEGYEACFGAPVTPGRQFDWIVDSVRELGGDGYRDDLTLVEIDTSATHVRAVDRSAPATRAASNWETTLSIEVPALRTFDPVPYLLQLLTEIQGLQSHKATLVTLLSELHVHALDHRLLGLNVESQARLEGLEHYYATRDTRLSALQRGAVRFVLRHRALDPGGELTIQVECNGSDRREGTPPPASISESPLPGRGLPLLRTLCQSVQFLGSEDRVEAVYRWGGNR